MTKGMFLTGNPRSGCRKLVSEQVIYMFKGAQLSRWRNKVYFHRSRKNKKKWEIFIFRRKKYTILKMIAILSDFKNSEYLGVMKGVIYSIAKNAKIVDLYNHIKPQEIKEGAWILLNSYRHFPKNTIFLCVVDPGVGSKRQ